jgi:hypothetical protein
MSLTRITLIAVVTLAIVALPVQAGSIDLVVNAYATYNNTITPIPTKCGDANPTPIMPGSVVTYEIAPVVDESAGSTVPNNLGLATIVFDVLNCGECSGYQMSPITAAESGYAELPYGMVGPLRYVTDPMYVDSGTTLYAGYNGGWGFDNSGLPIGGNVTSSLCDVLGAGAHTPLSWTADVNPTYPGLQPYARLGVGIGTYTFPPDDPAIPGIQAGFGQNLPNYVGDGHWLMFRATIDTSGWAAGADYGWNVVPTHGAVYSPTIDYNYDQGGGFRIGVDAADMTGDSFAFTLIPEPSAALVLLAAAALFRRRA